MRKKDNKPDILFISGSPRARTCVSLIDCLEQGAKNTGAKTQRFLLSKKHILPCTGCGSCNKTGTCALVTKTQGGRFSDDYLELKAVLERVDAVAIVAPLYFAGPPAQLKALYDRMQPYWAQRYVLGAPAPDKRPAQLFVVGSGGDAHGHAPLSTTTKSALAVAGFNLEKVNNFIGYVAPKDVPRYPGEGEASGYSHAQLAHIRRAIAQQEDFVQRAIAAGSAFARFVVKKKQAKDLAEQLAQVEAEIEVLKNVGDAEKPKPSKPPKSPTDRIPHAGISSDPKGDLRAEIALEYSNLISRSVASTPATAAPATPATGTVSAATAAPVTSTATAAVSGITTAQGTADEAKKPAEDLRTAPDGVLSPTDVIAPSTDVDAQPTDAPEPDAA